MRSRPCSWHHWLGLGKTGFCGRVCEAALPHRKKSHSEGFLTFACIRHLYHYQCPSQVKDVFATLDAASSSNHQSLAVEPFTRSAYGMHDLSPLSGSYSCERCSHCPIVDYLGPSLVRDLKSCPVVEILHVRFGADLILPSLTVSLVETPVLPTDGANCRGGFWGPDTASKRFWPKSPQTMNL